MQSVVLLGARATSYAQFRGGMIYLLHALEIANRSNDMVSNKG